MIDFIIEAFSKTAGSKHQIRNLAALLICGLIAFSVYERYTSYFRFTRIEKATTLLERLHELGSQVGNEKKMAVIHSSLVESLEEIVGISTKPPRKHSNMLRFLGGFWLWFAISLMILPSVKGKQDMSAIWGCWAFGLLFALFGMILPVGKWPWFHYLLYPILSLVGFFIFIAIIASAGSKSKKQNPEQSLGGDSENRAEDGTVPGAPQG